MKAICALVLASLAACKLPVKASSDIRVVGGEEIPETHPAFTSVVALAEKDAAGLPVVFCSGVLIANDLLVTAAHCLNRRPEDLRVYFGTPEKGEMRLVVEQKTFRDNYQHGKRLFPVFDIGWVRFAGELPKGAAPANILPDTAKLQPGIVYSMAGYGDTGTGRHDAGRQRLKADSVLTWYQEHPQAPGLILYGPTPGKGSCAADSGGPGYVQVDGEWFLAGVNNGKPANFIGMENASCEDGIGIQTSVTYFKSWLEETSGVKLKGPTSKGPKGTWPEKVVAHRTFQAWCEDPELPRAFFEFLQDAANVLNVIPSDCAALEKALEEGKESFLAVSPEILPLLKTLKNAKRLTISLGGPNDTFTSVDLKDLAGFEKLEQLVIYANDGDLQNQEQLSQLKNLRMLTIREASKLNLAVIASLTQLEDLRLASVPIRDLTFAITLSKLRFLDISLTSLFDVSAAGALKSLDHLELDQNEIVDVTAVAGLTNLKHLSLNNNQIENIAPLAALKELESLDLSGNKIKNVAPLRALTALRMLYLSANPLAEQVCPLPDHDGARVCQFQ